MVQSMDLIEARNKGQARMLKLGTQIWRKLAKLRKERSSSFKAGGKRERMRSFLSKATV